MPQSKNVKEIKEIFVIKFTLKRLLKIIQFKL